jgi:Fibronectin type III domain
VKIKMSLPLRVMLVAAAVFAAAPSSAGEIMLAWDSTSGASGYHVYYGTQSHTYTNFVTVASTTATISNLQDCQPYFIAVKAFNAAGESPQYSNELTGWPRPAVTSATPTSAMQGSQVVIDIYGSNFQSGAAVDLGNPNVFLSSVGVVSCSHIQLLATVEPTARNVRPAKVGKLDLTVANPDDVFGMKSQAFEVLINPARFDINQTEASTTNRIDGMDTIFLARDFGISESNPMYDANSDFDGDGWIDGVDLAYIASNLGRCWSASTKSWTSSACPANLR